MGNVQIHNEVELANYLRQKNSIALARTLCPANTRIDFEDILQGVFLRLKSRTFPLDAGIVKIAIRHEFLDELRKHNRRKEVFDIQCAEEIADVSSKEGSRLDHKSVIRNARNLVWLQTCPKIRHGWYALWLRTAPEMSGTEYLAILDNGCSDLDQTLPILNSSEVDWRDTYNLYPTLKLDGKHADECHSLIFEGVAAATKATAGQSAQILRTTTTTEGNWIAKCRKCLEPIALEMEMKAIV